MQDLIKLLPLAYRAAARVARCRFLAEEASERALHQLTLSTLAGAPPANPEAWIRVVARRTALSLARKGWGQAFPLDENDVPFRLEGREPAPPRPAPRSGTAYVRERIAPSLSPRQLEALDAALSCPSTRAAARRCGMQPRDFRRSLTTITRKARRLFEAGAQGSLRPS